jgi:hypothetical protein
MQVEWHGPGVFSHVDARVREWQAVLDEAAAIRLLENVGLHPWTAIYEVDVVEPLGECGRRRRAQYLVSE